MTFRDLFRYVVAIIVLQLVDGAAILNHFQVHVSAAESQHHVPDILFQILDLGNFIVKDIVTHLLVEILDAIESKVYISKTFQLKIVLNNALICNLRHNCFHQVDAGL